MRDAAALARAAADFIGRFGAPDLVIANAGISRGTLTEHAADAIAFREILDVNVTGLVHTFAPFVAAMRAAGRGTLVGIASVAGFRGLPGASAYSASKAAAISYLESLRVELAGSGVAVITICPGYIATPMTAGNPYRMPFLISAERAASADRARDRAQAPVLRPSLADGARRTRAARRAPTSLRPAVPQRSAEAAVIAARKKGRPADGPSRAWIGAGQSGMRRPTVTAQ